MSGRLLLKLALAPLLVAQGRRVRRRALRLPEAAGPREGRLGAEPGLAGPALRLLLAGDSSAAGVGVDHQDEALVGALADALHRRLARPVQWRLIARSGCSTPALARWLDTDTSVPPIDVGVVVTGVNDVLEQVSPRRALQARERLAARLLDAHGARHVVFAALPPMGRFPLLPQPLAHVLGRDAARHDAALARWAARRAGVSRAEMGLALTVENMARDGFHPGPGVYRHCGEALAAHIIRALALEEAAPT